jgi:hypothetical protein
MSIQDISKCEHIIRNIDDTNLSAFSIYQNKNILLEYIGDDPKYQSVKRKIMHRIMIIEEGY